MPKKTGPTGAKRYWAPHLVPSNRAEPGPWQVSLVSSGESKVAVSERQAYMPLPATKQDLMIARHEFGHVACGFTMLGENGEPLDGSSPVAVFGRMLQEPMVEVIATETGFDIRQARDGLDYSNRQDMPIPDESDWYTLARQTLQYAYSATESKNPDLKAFAAEVARRMRAHPYVGVLENAYVKVVAAAKAYGANTRDESKRARLGEVIASQARVLAERFGPEEKPTQPTHQTMEQSQARAAVVRAEAQQEADDRKAEWQEEMQRQQDGKQEPPGDVQAGAATKIEVHRHVTVKRAGKRAPSLWRSSPDSGPMRYPQRFLDGEPFGRRSKGGGILIDGSSSNSAAIAGLADTIQKLPNLWVGKHVGTGNSTGRICVIAEKGRFGWVGTEMDNGGNEGTDLPGMRMMVREASPPYVWVSDGLAWDRTARDGGNSQAYQRECAAFARKHGIVRVASVEAAAAYVLGKMTDVFEQPNVVFNTKVHGTTHDMQSTRRRK